MSFTVEEDSPFPADDGLFADTFSQDIDYTLWGQQLRIKQLFGANLGVASTVWDAAVLLCRFLELQRVELRGKRVLELGAGTGLLGTVAARLGATVVLTDLPVAVPQLQSNVSDNMPASGWPSTPPRVLPLSWGEDHNNFTSDWDLVLGADIVYLRDTFPLLIETLSHLCKNGAAVYLSSKMRKEHDCPRFFEEVLPRRFNVELLHRDEKQNINIYRAFLKRDQ